MASMSVLVTETLSINSRHFSPKPTGSGLQSTYPLIKLKLFIFLFTRAQPALSTFDVKMMTKCKPTAFVGRTFVFFEFMCEGWACGGKRFSGWVEALRALRRCQINYIERPRMVLRHNHGSNEYSTKFPTLHPRIKS